MGVEEVARGFGGKKLALASIGFAEVRAGNGSGAFKDDGLQLGVGLPKDDFLDGDVSFRVSVPDVGAAVRVRNRRSPIFTEFFLWFETVHLLSCLKCNFS